MHAVARRQLQAQVVCITDPGADAVHHSTVEVVNRIIGNKKTLDIRKCNERISASILAGVKECLHIT